MELLLSSIAGQDPPAEPVLLPVELIVRDSCGGPPESRPDPDPAAAPAAGPVSRIHSRAHRNGGVVTRIVATPPGELGELDRKVFGGFVEHLGRCIYGGLYDEGSPLADAQGFRTDVLGLLRELRTGRAALAGRQLRQQLPLDRRHRARQDAGRAVPSWPGAARSRTGSAPTSSWRTAPSWAPSPTSA